MTVPLYNLKDTLQSPCQCGRRRGGHKRTENRKQKTERPQAGDGRIFCHPVNRLTFTFLYNQARPFLPYSTQMLTFLGRWAVYLRFRKAPSSLLHYCIEPHTKKNGASTVTHPTTNVSDQKTYKCNSRKSLEKTIKALKRGGLSMLYYKARGVFHSHRILRRPLAGVLFSVLRSLFSCGHRGGHIGTAVAIEGDPNTRSTHERHTSRLRHGRLQRRRHA